MQMGKRNENWMSKYNIQYITICVTEDCNINCSYCYYINKNNKKKLSIEQGKRIINFILSNKEFTDKEGIHLEFIGGEPTLEIELIRRLCDYMVAQMFVTNHKWLNRYTFFMTTNGLLYMDNEFQNLLNRHKGHISVVISIDGIKEKHDMSRRTKDGKGTFDIVSKALPLWRKQFPSNSNKATFSHNDIMYLKDSVVFLWSIGIKNVNANIVFENVWKEGDVDIYRAQLYELADYILDNEMYEEYSVTFFSANIGHPVSYHSIESNVCGLGLSIAIDYDGNILPCHRFFECSFNNKEFEKAIIGNIATGFNEDRVRAFNCLSYEYIRNDSCIGCEVATGCSWCVGNNFCESNCQSIFTSVNYKCEMHKANAEVNQYLWSKIQKMQSKGFYTDYYSIKLMMIGEDTKFLYILTGEDDPIYCHYNNVNEKEEVISKELLKEAEEFCIKNNYIPVIIGNKEIDYPHYAIRKVSKKDTPFEIIVVDSNSINNLSSYVGTVIFNISVDCIEKLENYIEIILKYAQRININIIDLDKWTKKECNEYKIQMTRIMKNIYLLRKAGILKSIDVLDDIMYRNRHIGCNAGVNNFLLAPNGNIYICPAFYYDDASNDIGNLKGLNLLNQELYTLKKAILCNKCENYHCKRCIFLNNKLVGQINIPPEIQCIIGSIEKNIAKEFQDLLLESGINNFTNIIGVDFDDPIKKIYFSNKYLKQKRSI